MKKGYVKPALFYENFVLNQHIAGCKNGANSMDENNCTVTEGDEIFIGLFNNMDVCTVDASMSEEYCWTNGTISMGLFGS